MDKVKKVLDYYFNIISLVLLFFLLTGIVVLVYNDIKDGTKLSEKTINEPIETETISSVDGTIKVDIKGAVKKPGVYELNSSNNISDLITIAGGLTKNADTSNVNLSRILTDQMVIKIFTKSEIKKLSTKEITECVCPEPIITECVESSITTIDGTNQNTSNDEKNTPTSSMTIENETKLVSINTATKDELMTLNSIGEAKANAIIEYRNINGNFKSIEEIKNVSGIGDSLFEKIKSNITI